MEPTFFAAPAAFRRWLAKHHDKETELLVGFWKTSTGKPSMTWAESVDEALCYGWIDGVRRSLGEESYAIRFTPRKPTSTWSKVNVANAERLVREGRMRPAGLAAFQARKEAKTGTYSYENRPADLPPALAKRMRADEAAWSWFQGQPPSYRKAATWWVVSAKKEETRERRFATLVAESAAGRRLAPLTPGGGSARRRASRRPR